MNELRICPYAMYEVGSQDLYTNSSPLKNLTESNNTLRRLKNLGAKDSLKLQLPKIKSRHKISNRSSQTISIQRNSTTVKDP
ncbi:hypothetical protein JTB14_016941 [Gonioctena quinquepunctata]|nr:hypothetical protein JTB14_016941 [Gonioctena quinquepunctata]